MASKLVSTIEKEIRHGLFPFNSLT